MEDLLQIKFSLKSNYIKSHFNRSAKNNKYLGPDQNKTWRNLLNIHPPGTNLSIPTYQPESDIPAPASATMHQSSSDLPDGQILPRQTRSGRYYLAAIQTSNQELISVTKHGSNPDKDHHAQKKEILKSEK